MYRHIYYNVPIYSWCEDVGININIRNYIDTLKECPNSWSELDDEDMSLGMSNAN